MPGVQDFPGAEAVVGGLEGVTLGPLARGELAGVDDRLPAGAMAAA